MAAPFPYDGEERQRLERSAADAARVRDRQLRHHEERRDLLLRSYRQDFEAKVARVEREYNTARAAAFVEAERSQDATINFIEGCRTRRRAANFGLQPAFNDPVNDMERAARRSLSAAGWKREGGVWTGPEAVAK